MTSNASDTAALIRQAGQAMAGKRWDEAKRLLEAALALDGNLTAALLDLSYLGTRQGAYRAPADLVLRAFRQSPRDVATGVKLLNRLRNFHLGWAMDEYLAQAGFLRASRDPAVLHMVASHLSYLEKHEASLAVYNDLLRLQPNHPVLLFGRGQELVFLGRFDEARRDLEACLRQSPGMGRAWRSVANLRTQTPADNYVDALQRQLAAVRDPMERSYIAFALHKSLDDLGEHRRAWEALELACRERRRVVDYSDAEDEALFRELAQVPYDELPGPPDADPGFVPVFIVGMFRSGTTLLEHLLGANPALTIAGELFEFPAALRYALDHRPAGVLDRELVRRSRGADLGVIAASYAQGVRWRAHGHRFVTDKLPSNFLNLGLICRALPQARILHMTRDPMETCFSNLREPFGDAAPYSYDAAELAAHHRRYQALMAHWSRMFPGRILDVSYSRLVEDTEGVMRGVAAHCGMDFLPGMVDPRSAGLSVSTASVVQVRKPVTARKVPKWAPYAPWLGPLSKALGEPAGG